MPDELVMLAPGVLVRVADDDASTSGIVIAEDGVTVIDAGPTPLAAAGVAAAVAELTSTPVKRFVATSSHVLHAGGASAFPLAGVYGRAQTSDHLDQPPTPDIWGRMHPERAREFDDEVTTRRVTHTVTDAAHLCPASIAVPVAGFQFENLVVQVPAAGVVFAGSMVCTSEVPFGHGADPEVWLQSLSSMGNWGDIFVPARGHVAGPEALELTAAFITACINASGDPNRLASGPWNDWAHPERLPILVERAAMLRDGDPSPPPSMLRLIGR